MTASKPVNLREVFFPHATLTKVTGNPTFRDITDIRSEVLANARSVPSPFGGGAHGHMGIALSTSKYKRICPHPFIRPTAPTTYVAPTDPDLIVHHNAEKAYAKQVADFQLVNLVETTILNQLVLAFDKNVLRSKTDHLTRTIHCSIPDVFQYLFDTYGNITNFSLNEARQSTIAHTYVHSDSISNVFDIVDEYAEMADANNTPESSEQLISMTLMILMRANIFSDAISEWNNLPSASQTWPIFQDHFVQAQIDYKRSRPTDTSASLGYSPQANLAHYPQPPFAYTDHALNVASLYPEVPPPASDCDANTRPADPTPTLQANLATSTPDPLIQELLKEVKELRAERSHPTPAPSSTSTSDNKSKKREKGPRKYCWTHGACAHSSSECNKPKEGHKKEATFSDMMNGSTYKCFWVKNE